MPASRLLRRFTVGRWTCEISGTPATATTRAEVVVRWLPEMPASLTVAERREFRRHRDEALELIARALGITTAVAARAVDEALQPMADRAAAGKDERGSWNPEAT